MACIPRPLSQTNPWLSQRIASLSQLYGNNNSYSSLRSLSHGRLGLSLHLGLLLAQIRSLSPVFCPNSVQQPSPSSHSGTEPLQSTQISPSAHSLSRVAVRLPFFP